MLSPLDIRQKEFRKGFRGYDERQVDNFMEEVATTIEDLLKENDQLRRKIVESEERQQKYQELEVALKDTMVLAQKNAQDLKENADKEIKLLMQDAHQRAELLLQQAEEQAKKKVEQAEEQVKEIMEAYRQLQKQANVFKTQFRTFLETQLELLTAEPQVNEPEEEQAV
ncbi:DivIVA domain-containing protein [Peptococcaceae bacterium 1198_IL3148]